VLLLADAAGGTANWHQRVLPGLTLKAEVHGNGKVTFSVTDAGDPVGRAKVALVGGGSKTTGPDGTARFSLARGRHRATARKPGYAPGTASAHIR
jgi:hypothetical protein